MHICLIMDNPETPHHPVIAVALQQLAARHTVRLLDVRVLAGAAAIAAEEQQPRADLYLLKSHAPQALELAHYLEGRGSRVVNNWASAVACQDRVLMAERLRSAHLPWPETRFFPTLGLLLADAQALSTLDFPLIVKSHFSHRGDLVAKADNVEELQALGNEWSQEPVVRQAFAAGDGWDIKLWVIGPQLFAARRRTPLEPQASKQDFPIAPGELPEAWAHIVREIGRVFDMKLYGVDLLMTASGPIIVDVNAFPGFRGVPGADSALATLVEQLLAEEGKAI
jgi:ribosomal protein S6--L-glutamate ligase